MDVVFDSDVWCDLYRVVSVVTIHLFYLLWLVAEILIRSNVFVCLVLCVCFSSFFLSGSFFTSFSRNSRASETKAHQGLVPGCSPLSILNKMIQMRPGALKCENKLESICTFPQLWVAAGRDLQLLYGPVAPTCSGLRRGPGNGAGFRIALKAEEPFFSVIRPSPCSP